MHHYDFLLFENYHQAKNHKFDLMLIAKLLQHAGLKVAVLDIYHEDNEEEKEGIPVVHLKYNHAIPDDTWQLHPKNKFLSMLSTFRFLFQQQLYMKHVWKDVEPLADRFYCGSYHLMMPMTFFKSKKICYYWGLRSSRMTNFWEHFRENGITGLRMLSLRKKFLVNPSQKLFVSNQIIKKEFEQLGVIDDRLVIREERVTTGKEMPCYDQLSHKFSLLTLGMLRPDKRIDYTVKEFLSLNESENWEYVLAGKGYDKYEPIIERAITGHKNIKRYNEYLEYNKFYELIRKSHFVILADKQQESSVTNGTMMEALINYRPIIAPNYNPYKYYIEKYGVGLMFDPDKKGALSMTIKKANEIGIKTFEENIRNFLKTIEFENVSKSLYQQIYKR